MDAAAAVVLLRQSVAPSTRTSKEEERKSSRGKVTHQTLLEREKPMFALLLSIHLSVPSYVCVVQRDATEIIHTIRAPHTKKGLEIEHT